MTMTAKIIPISPFNDLPASTHATHTLIDKISSYDPATARKLDRLPSPFAPKQHYTDILHELTENRQDYTVSSSNDPWFTITSIPNLVDASIKRCISSAHWREVNQRKPGYSAVCACAITLGLHQLLAIPAIDAIRNLKSEIYSLPCESAKLDEAHTMASNFVLGDMDALTGTKAQRNIQFANPDTRGELSEVAVELGLSATKFAVVCLVYALREQTFVLPGHATLMHELTNKFLLRANVRVKLSHVLIEWLKQEAQEVTL